MNKTDKTTEKTTEAPKTMSILFDAVNCLGGAVWDLKIIENNLVTSLENEQIIIPDVDCDPLRIALLALRAVRTDLEKQEDTLWVQLQEEQGKEAVQTTEKA